MRERISWCDRLLAIADQGLRATAGAVTARRPSPAGNIADDALSVDEAATSAALMRVNRAGEIAAQALYLGQALFARSDSTRRHLFAAAAEERDHLAWCTQRLAELGGRNSLLDPFWYAGSAVTGVIAGAAGDGTSLGFVGETEKQVEAHIDDHLGRLPVRDGRSRAILEQMAADEAHHGTTARLAGGHDMPPPVRRLMALGGALLRRGAYYV